MKRATGAGLPVFILALVALAVLSRPVTAGAEVETRTIYYDIGGANDREIRAGVRTHPVMRGSYRYYAWVKSEWSTKWTIWWREGEAGCVLTAVEASVLFENTLPNWLNETSGDPDLRARWRRTRAALELYVQQSMSSGISAATEIKSLYRRIGAFPTCEELENAFHKRADRISNLYRKSAKAIANRLDHGTKLYPKLRAPAGVQTPVAGSPGKELDGWCQISSDLDTVQQQQCRFERTCAEETARCTISYSWDTEEIQVQYEDGEPVSWDDQPAGYAFINGRPCVRRTSDKDIFCFSEQRPDRVWFFHLP